MPINRTNILVVLVILEGAVIAALLMTGIPRIRVNIARTPVTLPANPISLAVEYESPDAKFEQVVKDNLGWLQFRPNLGDDVFSVGSVLSECAILERTNYVRILIAHGADVNEALDWLEKRGTQEARSLIRQVVAEAGQKRRDPRN